MTYFCRTAPSLGALEGTHTEAWGTTEYDPLYHKFEPCVFFGLFDFSDYLALWKHRGKKYILWCGADLENLKSGFMLNDGKLKFFSHRLGIYWLSTLLKSAINYVEDEYEADILRSLGIPCRIVPSFMGKFEDWPITYKCKKVPDVFISGHPDREDEYGFSFVDILAKLTPGVKFHLYGSKWRSKAKNVICHGLVPKEAFNAQIKLMQCGLRLNTHDGASEIMVKSLLCGGYPITRLKYPLVPQFSSIEQLASLLDSLKEMKKPNIKTRNFWIKYLNQYPWVQK